MYGDTFVPGEVFTQEGNLFLKPLIHLQNPLIQTHFELHAAQACIKSRAREVERLPSGLLGVV